MGSVHTDHPSDHAGKMRCLRAIRASCCILTRTPSLSRSRSDYAVCCIPALLLARAHPTFRPRGPFAGILADLKGRLSCYSVQYVSSSSVAMAISMTHTALQSCVFLVVIRWETGLFEWLYAILYRSEKGRYSGHALFSSVKSKWDYKGKRRGKRKKRGK